VIAQTKKVQIYTDGYQTHFAFCDRFASCVIVEGMNGKLNLYYGLDLEVPVVTNTAYPDSLAAWAQCPGADCPGLSNSRWRFVTGANMVTQFTGIDFTKGVFDILYAIRESLPQQNLPTLWTILTHQSLLENRFHLKNTASSKIVINLDFQSLDYSCKTPVRVAMLSSDDSSDGVQWADYSLSFQQQISAALENFGASDEEIQRRVDYPAKFTRCAETGQFLRRMNSN